jgi:phosphoglycolate phosphatase-like HAD superfamily hydrolase
MRCYVFDLDGTLADGKHRIHYITEKDPKDWDAYFAECAGDTLIDHIAELAWDLAKADAHIVYVTGRTDTCEKDTREWLRRHTLPNGKLYMRKAGDHRNDDELKIEMLAQVRADGYRPIMAFEDRARVVKAYRETGLPCAQVAEGDF